MSLSDEAIERYSRQLILPGWSTVVQQRLAERSVAVSTDLPACALYLAAAGVGDIVLVGTPDPQLEFEISALNPLVRVDRGEEIDGSTPVDCAVGLPEYTRAKAHIVITREEIRYSDPSGVHTFGTPSRNRVFSGSAAAAALLLVWRSGIHD